MHIAKHVQFSHGQQVLLSTRDLKLKGKVESHKLLPRFIGLFTIMMLVGSSEQKVVVQLHLHANMKRLHHGFHVSLLKSYTPSLSVYYRGVHHLPLTG
jgi:hypothetical protein